MYTFGYNATRGVRLAFTSSKWKVIIYCD